jgi:hypothetical protein
VAVLLWNLLEDPLCNVGVACGVSTGTVTSDVSTNSARAMLLGLGTPRSRRHSAARDDTLASLYTRQQLQLLLKTCPPKPTLEAATCWPACFRQQVARSFSMQRTRRQCPQNNLLSP